MTARTVELRYQASMSTLPPCNTEHVRRVLSDWAVRHLRGFPWREDGTSVYEVLIAEVLLKRTTARAAARVFVDFTVRFPDLSSVVMAPLEGLEGVLGPVGLYRQRAKGLKEMARYLMNEHSGQIPGHTKRLTESPPLGAIFCQGGLVVWTRLPCSDRRLKCAQGAWTSLQAPVRGKAVRSHRPNAR